MTKHSRVLLSNLTGLRVWSLQLCRLSRRQPHMVQQSLVYIRGLIPLQLMKIPSSKRRLNRELQQEQGLWDLMVHPRSSVALRRKLLVQRPRLNHSTRPKRTLHRSHHSSLLTQHHTTRCGRLTTTTDVTLPCTIGRLWDLVDRCLIQWFQGMIPVMQRVVGTFLYHIRIIPTIQTTLPVITLMIHVITLMFDLLTGDPRWRRARFHIML
mmetsp:Transcript_49663/g.67602  ORF Transcript_49663/g.67602 Transcript_49663/m.67602 type:complete len:210 (+) Transcript_49663:437-1066(+)